MIKVLHVIPTYVPAYRYGGPVAGIHELCKALPEHAVQPTVFTTDVDWENRLETQLRVEKDVDDVRVTYYPVKLLRSYYYSRELSKALEERVNRFDLVHIHSVFVYPTYVAAFWCYRKGVPYIINPFGALNPAMIRLKSTVLKKAYIKLLERNNLEHSTAIHVASDMEKKGVLSLGLNKPIAVVPMGINPQIYKPDDRLSAKFEQRYPQLKGKKIVLFLGRIHYKKGLDLLPAVLKKLVNKHSDVRLVIAGPSEKGYADRVKTLFKKEEMSDYVVFTGMLLGEEKLSALCSSEIFVLPSYGENFGITVLEAMACGLPVVVTDCVGVYPEVEKSNAGIITKCNAIEIANALFRLLDDESLRNTMGLNGRSLTLTKYTWRQIAGRMADIYFSINKGVSFS